MEHRINQIYTDENIDHFQNKHERITQDNRSTTTRVALGQLSNNVSKSSNAPSRVPAQRIPVYTEDDKNNVPVARPVKQDSKANVERQALAEIRNNEDHSKRIDVYEAENSYDDLANESVEEELDDILPEGLMPIIKPSIYRELITVYSNFYTSDLDYDDEDTYDVSMVAEYSPEIFNYLHELEVKLRPNPRYMESQSELKWNMRSILIDWLIQVHSKFNLLPETLYLTVNYIDRFLSKRKVSLSKFQLVGAVALFIAAKYEEINCPSVKEIAYMVDHAYSVEDILKAERFMIDVLEFEMGWPGPMSFLRRTSKADDYDFETRTLAKYFLEITVMDYRFVASPPSWLAAGAHYLSRLILNRGEWTKAHVYYSGYTSDQLRPLAQVLLEACRNPEEHHKTIFEKYKERRFRRSSLFVQEWFGLADES